MLNSYWEYAGTRYKHKFKVLEASHGNYHDVSFHLFDDPSFENYDWTVEPSESIKDLMLTRAYQLRDSYSYLKFWFSGGNDSTTALNVFLDNNIHIDEIVTYKFAPDNKDTNPGDYEIDNHVLPYLKELQKSIPKTKIKILNYDHDFFDKYLGDRWVHTKNNLSIRHFYIPKINGKNFCNIICDGEPMIECINGKWYAELWDTDNYAEFAPYRNIELFYTTPSLPDLHAKQCHMMKAILSKQYSKRPVYHEWKQLLRENIRDKAIAPEPWWFQKKSVTPNILQYTLGPKDLHMLRTMTSEQRDKIRHQMNLSLGGHKLFRLQHGFKAHTFYLGE